MLTPVRHSDARGYFSEVYNRRDLAIQGIATEFVQDNHSYSDKIGTVRGLHFQVAPHAQVKLVRVAQGSVFDVAVDIRRSSKTFGKHVSAVISAENGRQILVPEGFAHGFMTLEPHTEVLYKTSDYYAPKCEAGLLWSDPELGIDWPVPCQELKLSGKDMTFPSLSEVKNLFE